MKNGEVKQHSQLKNATLMMNPKEGGEQLKIKFVTDTNIRKAIENSNLIRIRSGSPGQRATVLGTGMANSKSKDVIEAEFIETMDQHGITKDLQEIQRFNMVLASRSIDEPSPQKEGELKMTVTTCKSEEYI